MVNWVNKEFRRTMLLLVGMTIVNVALVTLVYGLIQVRNAAVELQLWDQMMKILTARQSFQVVVCIGMILAVVEIGIIVLIRKAVGKDED